MPENKPGAASRGPTRKGPPADTGENNPSAIAYARIKDDIISCQLQPGEEVTGERIEDFFDDFEACRIDEVLGAYKFYPDVIKDALRRACAHWGIEYRETDGEKIVADVPNWGPHPDVPEPLARIAEHFPLVILSNAAGCGSGPASRRPWRSTESQPPSGGANWPSTCCGKSGSTGRSSGVYAASARAGNCNGLSPPVHCCSSRGLLVCDEPTSALDAPLRAQIINLLMTLKKRFDLTLLIISHDLRVVRYVSDRVAVMYLGKIVEIGERSAIFERPLHPYTRALISASLLEENGLAASADVRGEPPSPLNPPSGCRFHPRCTIAQSRCARDEPELLETGDGHRAACFYWSRGERVAQGQRG